MDRIKDLVNNFKTTPFLFIGSGISRRYLNLPDWKSLLKHFAEILNTDKFSYISYENKVDNRTEIPKMGKLPKVAELIQADFDRRWYEDPKIRSVKGDRLDLINQGLSPFKAEVANYIESFNLVAEKYKYEVDKLRQLSLKNITGVITTNYDTFIEDHFIGYKKYVGQKELIFSALLGIAEIYKIHGSVENPESIVINERDYIEFIEKSTYLAAKLMTIFIEYPIIFLGYSINDVNIQNIIKAIVNCLNSEQIKKLEDRFIFVEYDATILQPEVSSYTVMIDEKPLTMKKIMLSDFMPLYGALESKQSKMPAKVLRKFKEDIYNYTITNTPSGNLRVASIEDNRIDDEDLVLAIGRSSELGLKGLNGIESSEWYRNIVLKDLDFSADDLLEHAFQRLLKNNSVLPVNKYLCEATKEFPECKEIAEHLTFDSIISKSLRNNRRLLGKYTSVLQIWSAERGKLERATRFIAYLKEEQIDLLELENVLQQIFADDREVLVTSEAAIKANIRRLIRIYDYLKWGIKKSS